MKKKILSFLLLPLILASCGNSGVSLIKMREAISQIPDDASYPIYKVVGSLDLNGVPVEVDETFDQTPGYDTFVPYSRYNEGFYNATVDNSEPKLEDIMIYSLASKSYWLRAPLRITSANFYGEVYTIKSSYINGEVIRIDEDDGKIGSLSLKNAEGSYSNYTNVAVADVNNNSLTLNVTLEEQNSQIIFNRETAVDETFLYAGKFIDANKNEINIEKGTRENTTCAHYLIQHIITSYVGQTGSTNPSKNQMKMEINDKGYLFYGEAVHTSVLIDNFPYYPDPSRHGDTIVEWDPEFPIPCYKNNVNAKVNIKLQYDKNGWLIKEEMASIDYDYNSTSTSQVALVAVYGYKFS